MRLIDNADWVLKRAWSVRLIIIAGILSGVEALNDVLTAFQIGIPGLPSGVFAALAGAVSCAAFIARIVAQEHAE